MVVVAAVDVGEDYEDDDVVVVFARQRLCSRILFLSSPSPVSNHPAKTRLRLRERHYHSNARRRANENSDCTRGIRIAPAEFRDRLEARGRAYPRIDSRRELPRNVNPLRHVISSAALQGACTVDSIGRLAGERHVRAMKTPGLSKRHKKSRLIQVARINYRSPSLEKERKTIIRRLPRKGRYERISA